MRFISFTVSFNSASFPRNSSLVKLSDSFISISLSLPDFIPSNFVTNSGIGVFATATPFSTRISTSSSSKTIFPPTFTLQSQIMWSPLFTPPSCITINWAFLKLMPCNAFPISSSVTFEGFFFNFRPLYWPNSKIGHTSKVTSKLRGCPISSFISPNWGFPTGFSLCSSSAFW